MRQRVSPPPRDAGERRQRHPERDVLLAPADEARVHRDLGQRAAGGDDVPTTRNPQVRALLKGQAVEVGTGHVALRGGFGKPAHATVGNRPPCALLDGGYRFPEPGVPDVGVGQHNDVGATLRNGGVYRLRFDPGVGSGCDGDRPAVAVPHPIERSRPVATTG